MIKISVESSYERYAHYSNIVVCGCFDADSNMIFFDSAKRADGEQRTELEIAAAPHHIELIVYFTPNFLPDSKRIEDYHPFEASICVESGTKVVYDTVHKINAWGGSAVRLILEL